MYPDNNLEVTIGFNAKNKNKKYQVFVTNKEERFIFGLKEFKNKKDANQYAENLVNRWSCKVADATI